MHTTRAAHAGGAGGTEILGTPNSPQRMEGVSGAPVLEEEDIGVG